MSKYGEPWLIESFHDAFDDESQAYNGCSVIDNDDLKRAILCVNVLAGIPDEELRNVLRCWVAFKHEDYDSILKTIGKDIHTFPELALLKNLDNLKV